MSLSTVPLPAITTAYYLAAFPAMALFWLLGLALHSRSSRKAENDKKQNLSTDQAYESTFPPQQREAVRQLSNSTCRKYQAVLTGPAPSQIVLQRRQMPTSGANGVTTDVQYTPTGFSLAEIQALGSFPDYSFLSGVPHPEPCLNFDITKALFRPFRPFRWTYHQTMSLQKFQPNFWIELEQNYFASLKQRKTLLEQHGTNIMNYGSGSALACRELMEMVLQFVCIRYPHYFQLKEDNTVFANKLLETRTILSLRHPLQVLFDNIPEDFAIMMRDEKDGMYYLRAGHICSSIGWTFGRHFNRQLRAIHTEVNDYAEKMAKSMDRYFSKMPTNQPIQRGAWFVEDWKPLFVTPDEYAANAGTRHQGEPVAIDQCNLRVDWQTLRRLPLSGAIVFNFKAIFTPMTELRDEPYIPHVLYKQITEGKPNITQPKVHEHIRPVVLEALDEWKKEQVASGVVPTDWPEETLKETPFYPGWEETWKQRQGFGA